MAITIDEQLRNTELKHAPVDAIQNLGEVNQRAVDLADAALEFTPIGEEIDFESIKTGLVFEDFLNECDCIRCSSGIDYLSDEPCRRLHD